MCIVMVEPTAERTFVTTLGAERDITVDSLATADVQPGDLVCVTGYTLAVEQTRQPLLEWLVSLPEEAVVVLDPGAAFAAVPADVRDTMLQHTDVWTSNAEEASDLLSARAVPVEASDREIVAQAHALAPLMRAEAITIVRDGAEGCAVHVAGETTYVPGFPQTARRHQWRRRHAHGCAAGGHRRRCDVAGSLPPRQRCGCDQSHPSRPDDCTHRDRGRGVPSRAVKLGKARLFTL